MCMMICVPMSEVCMCMIMCVLMSVSVYVYVNLCGYVCECVCV